MSRYIGVPDLHDDMVWINTAHIVTITDAEETDWASGRKTVKWRTTITTTGGNGLGGGVIRTLCAAKDVMLAALDTNSIYKEVNK